jgi:hypothetical protein
MVVSFKRKRDGIDSPILRFQMRAKQTLRGELENECLSLPKSPIAPMSLGRLGEIR